MGSKEFKLFKVVPVHNIFITGPQIIKYLPYLNILSNDFIYLSS